jgi:uncharacterized LabA/DUF88 family protein
MKKVALLIDGGYLRESAKRSQQLYNPDFIERFSHQCIDSDEEELYRILYYDCAPYIGTVRLPVSGQDYNFTGSDIWLDELASRNYFAVRRGVLEFRGWVRRTGYQLVADSLTDNDFKPLFVQKGVDIRLGLDIASLGTTKSVDRVVLVCGDSDMIPAMKYGRKLGLQIVFITLPNVSPPKREILAHADIIRNATAAGYGQPASPLPGRLE